MAVIVERIDVSFRVLYVMSIRSREILLSMVTATHHYVLRTVYVCLILRTAIVRFCRRIRIIKKK